MCGIVGVAGNVSVKEENIFKELLILDTLRGLDSTGVATVGKGMNVIVAKRPGDPFQLFETDIFKESLRRKNYILIGHNRAATQGKVNRANAHPFEFDGLVGVHNGTLRNKSGLDDHWKFDTDSEALYFNINKNGLQAAIEKAVGAYSLVWADKNDGTLNFLRNDERPMKLLFSEDRKTLFFASESWMLTCILARNGYKYGVIEDLPVDTHFSFQVPVDGKEFEKAKVRHVKPAPFPVIQKTTPQSTVAQPGTGNTGKTGADPKMHPLAEEVLKRFQQRNGLSLNEHDIKVGKVVTAYASEKGIAHGNMFVSFIAKGFEECTFRCFVKDSEEANGLIGKHYTGRVTSMNYEQGKWIYKINPDTLQPVANIIELIIQTKKHDHANQPISKAEFESRYGNCAYCASPVLFEENWVALSKEDCLCEACKDSPEVQQYIPDLKKAC